MVHEFIGRIKNHEFSEDFFVWVSTLSLLPFVIYLRFILSTSLILDRYYPEFLRMVLILGLVTIFWLCTKWYRDRSLVLTGLEVYLGIFVIVILLSTIFSANFGLSVENSIGIFGYILVVYILLDIKKHKYIWQGIINSLLITAAVSSAVILVTLIPYLKIYQIGFVQILTDPIYVYKALPRLPYSLLLHPSVTAGYLVLMIPLGIYQLSQSRKPVWKILLGLGIVINLAVLVLTRSRGGIIGFVFMAVGAFFSYRKELLAGFQKKNLLVFFIVFTLGTIGIIFIFLLAQSRGFDLTGWSIQSRFQLWKAGLMIIQERPWLGSGPGTFGQEYLRFRDASFEARSFIHAHNQILQLTSELGVLGFFSLLLILWKYFQALAREGFSPHQRFGLIALFGLFGVLLPDAILTSTMIVFLMIFYLVWMAPEGKKLGNNPVNLYVFTAFSIIIYIGASWITWKIEPYYKAVSESYQGNWQEVTKQIEIALQRDPNNPYYQYVLGYSTGQEACSLGEGFNDSINHYSSSLESYPNWDISYANLAGLYAEIGDYKQAADQMENAIQAYPHKPFYLCLLGDYYREMGRIEDALKEYSGCLIGLPSVLDSPYWNENDQRASLQDQVIREVKELFGMNEEDLLAESEFSYYAGDSHKALTLVLEYLDEDPLEPKANLLQYRILEGMGRLPDIESQLAMMLHNNPEKHNFWLYAAKLALINGDISTAENALLISKMSRPTLYGVLTLGTLYLDMGEVSRAKGYFQEFLLMSVNSSMDFSRHVAGRWPIAGVYTNCLSGNNSYSDHIIPALDAAQKLEGENCLLAACIYHNLAGLYPPYNEAINLLGDLPCFQEFDPEECLVGFE